MQRCPQREQIPAEKGSSCSEQPVCLCHALYVVPEVSEQFSTKRGKSPHCTAICMQSNCKPPAPPRFLALATGTKSVSDEMYSIAFLWNAFQAETLSLPHPRTGASGKQIFSNHPTCLPAAPFWRSRFNSSVPWQEQEWDFFFSLVNVSVELDFVFFS